jgi:hypothetical protein
MSIACELIAIEFSSFFKPQWYNILVRFGAVRIPPDVLGANVDQLCFGGPGSCQKTKITHLFIYRNIPFQDGDAVADSSKRDGSGQPGKSTANNQEING